MRVTACELRTGRLEEDWAALAEHVRAERSELVVLPEMGLSPWFAHERPFVADAWSAAVRGHAAFMAERLGELGDAVVLGTAPVEREGSRLNEAFVADAGGVRGAHLKFHLPDEADFWEAS